MVTPDRKVRKLMEEYQKTGNLTKSALRADLDPKTARKYVRAGRLPCQMRSQRHWRTRRDPFEGHWEEVRGMLADAPELEAKALFEWLCERYPESYQEGQVRTFQRRVRRWRALEGPPREVYFPQEHEPGVRLATDFTWMGDLGITIRGRPFAHLMCHSVLPYSNWEWGTVCHSESLLALKRGLQAALLQLGRLPREHWTDHSTAATHTIGGDEAGPRQFNSKYLDLMRHFGLTPRTINVGEPHEAGDVESANGNVKRRLRQHLLLRGSRDFDDLGDYVRFMHAVIERANRLRQTRLVDELAVMRPLDVDLLPEYVETQPRVTSWSTVQVGRNTYSVPSRLRGERVEARLYDDLLEIYCHGVLQVSCPRLVGERKHTVNYRHVIDSLVRKPGAFRHYCYADEMFPTESFRWAYEVLSEHLSARAADVEYLRILAHAAHTMETAVDKILCEMKLRGQVPRWAAVEESVPAPRPGVPHLPQPEVRLTDYDCLLATKEVVA